MSLQPPEGSSRTPTDMCIVIDTSASMGTEASIGSAGSEESHGLSLLDVVKHAVKTVIQTLGRHDRLSLVGFSSTATTIFDLLTMDARGKATAERKLAELRPHGQTNLWDGLYHGLETLRTGEQTGSLPVVLLLTDGQPNVIPPRGHIPMLKRYQDEHMLHCPVNTFGFGYKLDSALLHELASEGEGMYTFIPDASFVGTAFVNATANMLSTMATNATLTIEAINGATLVGGEGCVMGHPHSETSWGRQVSLGTLHYGQHKDVVLKMSVPRGAAPYLTATLRCQCIICMYVVSCRVVTCTHSSQPHPGTTTGTSELKRPLSKRSVLNATSRQSANGAAWRQWSASHRS